MRKAEGGEEPGQREPEPNSGATGGVTAKRPDHGNGEDDGAMANRTGAHQTRALGEPAQNRRPDTTSEKSKPKRTAPRAARLAVFVRR